ncbi:MAG TPA: helix-turn-helix domain-containing protein [Planctomycetota bacterium]|nr:helix-turn-helix domain-containing protein [Planctomycetota bacterium]
MAKQKKTRNALELIARDVGDNPAYQAILEEERLNLQVARLIYEARVAAKLTQKRLAALAGTTQPVIARLEDANYEGHSLTMLRRIAEAMNSKVVVSFVPAKRKVRRA